MVIWVCLLNYNWGFLRQIPFPGWNEPKVDTAEMQETCTSMVGFELGGRDFVGTYTRPVLVRSTLRL